MFILIFIPDINTAWGKEQLAKDKDMLNCVAL